ncbi:hypothetical protein OG568_43190 [Streptomyces sp. NBC_01450]
MGLRIAAVGVAFGTRVVAWSNNLDPAHTADHGVEALDKHELFSSSDIITVHCRLSERSKGIIGVDELGWMKPTALLINTSHGPLVDASALVAAPRASRSGSWPTSRAHTPTWADCRSRRLSIDVSRRAPRTAWRRRSHRR